MELVINGLKECDNNPVSFGKSKLVWNSIYAYTSNYAKNKQLNELILKNNNSGKIDDISII